MFSFKELPIELQREIISYDMSGRLAMITRLEPSVKCCAQPPSAKELWSYLERRQAEVNLRGECQWESISSVEKGSYTQVSEISYTMMQIIEFECPETLISNMYSWSREDRDYSPREFCLKQVIEDWKTSSLYYLDGNNIGAEIYLDILRHRGSCVKVPGMIQRCLIWLFMDITRNLETHLDHWKLLYNLLTYYTQGLVWKYWLTELEGPYMFRVDEIGPEEVTAEQSKNIRENLIKYLHSLKVSDVIITEEVMLSKLSRRWL